MQSNHTMTVAKNICLSKKKVLTFPLNGYTMPTMKKKPINRNKKRVHFTLTDNAISNLELRKKQTGESKSARIERLIRRDKGE